MPTWPSSLPQRPLLDGYEEKLPDCLLRTQMDAGPAKVRRRFTAATREYRVAYIMTTSQLDTLDQFFVTDCKHGSLSFTWPHPRTGSNVTARFIGPPVYHPVGPHWRVECNIEELP